MFRVRRIVYDKVKKCFTYDNADYFEIESPRESKIRKARKMPKQEASAKKTSEFQEKV